MGFSYDNRGHLCCDSCGAPGGVRKRRCPFGYCPSIAQCSDCYKKSKAAGYHSKIKHESCRVSAEKQVERERAREAILASGKAVRCAALNADVFTDGPNQGFSRVHVLFRKKDGSTIGHYVTSATYDAVPLLTPATPETYAEFGEVTEAPNNF